MKVLIETYRDFEIYFETDGELFYSISDKLDYQMKKQSYASSKASIDEYIKKNLNFKPIWVERNDSYFYNNKKIKLVGIRKDGRFVFENDKGEKGQLSEYDERNYFISNSDNEPVFKRIEEKEEQIKALTKELEVINKTLIVKCLRSYLRQNHSEVL